jgi:hypothetical protein
VYRPHSTVAPVGPDAMCDKPTVRARLPTARYYEKPLILRYAVFGFRVAAPPGASGDRRRIVTKRAGEPLHHWGESAQAVGPLFRPEPVS